MVLIDAPVSGNLFTTQNVSAMDTVERRMSQTPGVKSVIGPAFFVKLAVKYYSGLEVIPPQDWMVQAILKDAATGQVRSDFASVFPDQNHALIAIQIDDNVRTEAMGGIIDTARKTVASAGFSNGVHPIVTGEPTILQQVNDSLGSNLWYMLLAAALLMLTILAIVFNVRNFFAWRWPTSVTRRSATGRPPAVAGASASECLPAVPGSAAGFVERGLLRVAPRAIIASGLTVIAGFGALLIARDFPVLQDFGVITMINVFFALASTLVVLPPLIVLIDSRLMSPQRATAA